MGSGAAERKATSKYKAGQPPPVVAKLGSVLGVRRLSGSQTSSSSGSSCSSSLMFFGPSATNEEPAKSDAQLFNQAVDSLVSLYTPRKSMAKSRNPAARRSFSLVGLRVKINNKLASDSEQTQCGVVWREDVVNSLAYVRYDPVGKQERSFEGRWESMEDLTLLEASEIDFPLAKRVKMEHALASAFEPPQRENAEFDKETKGKEKCAATSEEKLQANAAVMGLKLFVSNALSQIVRKDNSKESKREKKNSKKPIVGLNQVMPSRKRARSSASQASTPKVKEGTTTASSTKKQQSKSSAPPAKKQRSPPDSSHDDEPDKLGEGQKKKKIRMSAQDRWSKEEDEILLECIKQGITSWSDICAHIPGRKPKQARERWTMSLDPSIVRSPWTPEEDEKLIRVHKKIGNKWASMKEEFPHRSPDQLKTRINTLERAKKRDATIEWTEKTIQKLIALAECYKELDQLRKHLPRELRGASTKALFKHCPKLMEMFPGEAKRIRLASSSF